MHCIQMRLQSWLQGESCTLVMYALVSLGVRAGCCSSITTLVSPFSLPLTVKNESSSTQCCRGKQGKRVFLCGGGRVTVGCLDLCRGYGAGNKVCCVCVCVCVCVWKREREWEKGREVAGRIERDCLWPVTWKYHVFVSVLSLPHTSHLCYQEPHSL